MLSLAYFFFISCSRSKQKIDVSDEEKMQKKKIIHKSKWNFVSAKLSIHVIKLLSHKNPLNSNFKLFLLSSVPFHVFLFSLRLNDDLCMAIFRRWVLIENKRDTMFLQTILHTHRKETEHSNDQKYFLNYWRAWICIDASRKKQNKANQKKTNKTKTKSE